MGSWSLYFFVKIALYALGTIGFHVWPNLLLAVFVALPARRTITQIAKQTVAVPAGVLLLHYDSWLPPLSRLAAQWSQLLAFSPAYYLDLLSRVIELRTMLAVLLFLLIYWLLSRKLRLSTFAFLGIVTAPWLAVLSGAQAPIGPVAAAGDRNAQAATGGLPSANELEQKLQDFREQARQRVLRMPAAGLPPFDVLFLQICSLSWQDLDSLGLRGHPFLQRFDIRFDRFNSAASYSGPAAIRLLRSGCGQTSHAALYRPAADACYLLPQLEQSGFTQAWAMNHDGVFGDMNDDITVGGGVTAQAFPLTGRKPAYRSFDGSTYYEDYDVLSAWWQQRLEQDSERVALYYNSVSLHDGNRFLDGRRLKERESYRQRLLRLFDDLGRFVDEVAASGRRAVIVIVPEHGANLEGDRLQMQGMREIPTPGISLVPTGVLLIGEDGPESDKPAVADAPLSHFGLASLIAAMIDEPPFGEAAPRPADYLLNLPETPMVSENDGMLVMRAAGRDWLRDPEGRWSALQLR